MSKEKKVAILGFAPSSLSLAPYNDHNFEIWVLNEYFTMIPNHKAKNITRWFELHQRETVLNSHRSKDYLSKLKESEIPIMMVKKFDDIPMSVEYPLEKIIKSLKTDYFTNSISYMIAQAIYEGYTHISLYGIDMAQSEEYCVSKETLVLMKDLTYKMAGDVEIGDELLAFDEDPQGASNDRGFRISKVEENKIITRPCYRLTFEDGTQVTCSQEHRWLVGGSQNKWVETQNLVARGARKDGSCSHIVKPFDVWEPIKTYESGYLAGAIDGEGWLCQTKHCKNEGYNFTLGFCQRQNDMLNSFIEYSSLYGFDFSKYENDDDCAKLRLNGKRREAIRFLGSIRPKRLLEKLEINYLGRMVGEKIALVKKEYVGDQEVVALGTSTGTFIAEGLASHNSKERPSVEYFVGYARAKGIEVYIPKESDICKAPYYYGFQEQVASKVVNILDPKIKDLTDRITNDDICFDEMIEHMDYHLKRYLFEYKPTVEQLRLSQQKIINLNNKLRGKDINSDESKSIVEEIKSVENVNVPVFEIDKLIDAIWESIQRLKGAKKERLFLAGAEETSKHLRMILCPFD